MPLLGCRVANRVGNSEEIVPVFPLSTTVFWGMDRYLDQPNPVEERRGRVSANFFYSNLPSDVLDTRPLVICVATNLLWLSLPLSFYLSVSLSHRSNRFSSASENFFPLSKYLKFSLRSASFQRLFFAIFFRVFFTSNLYERVETKRWRAVWILCNQIQKQFECILTETFFSSFSSSTPRSLLIFRVVINWNTSIQISTPKGAPNREKWP